MDIRGAIRAEQGWNNWTDAELAERAGLNQSTFSRRMAGRDFKAEELEKIAQAFNLRLSELVELAEQREPETTEEKITA